MAERFYANQDLGPGEVILTGPESHHLAVVCRVRVGDMVCLFNGDGREYPARVVAVSKRDVTVEVLSIATPEREEAWEFHLAVPLPKGDRAQFLVEKLTELGVQRLTLLSTERSVVQPREAKVEKLHRYVIEASKQCGRNALMAIAGPTPFGEFVRDGSLPEHRLLAHPSGEAAWPGPKTPIVIMVGPEGGFTDDEVRLAVSAGWSCVGLGPRILRVETAAMALAARASLPTRQVSF